MAEEPFEVHNRLAIEISSYILQHLHQPTDIMIVLESVLVGVIGYLPVKLGEDGAMLQLLSDGAEPRLTANRLRRSQATGEA